MASKDEFWCSPLSTGIPLRIRAVSFSTPREVISSSQIDLSLELQLGTISGECGVERRFHVSPDETVISLAVKAADSALIRAELNIRDIDLILAAGATPYQLIPSNAVLVHRGLGAPAHVNCLDLDSTCLSFLSGLEVAAALIHSGTKKRIMLLNSELGSSGIDRTQREDVSLFGDAATCYILEKGDDTSPRLMGSRFATLSEFHDLCQLEGGGSKFPAFDYSEENRHRYYFRMQGPKLFKTALAYLPDFVNTFLTDLGISMSDIGVVVPHQASGPAVELLRRKLAVPKERCAVILNEYGNCISASIPLALAGCLGEAVTGYCPPVKAGHHVLLVGTGAGLTMGAAVIRF